MASIIKHDNLEGQLKVRRIFDTKEAMLPRRGVVSARLLEATAETEKILEDARKKGEKIISQAKKLRDSMKAAIEKEKKRGYDEGYEEGLSKTTEQMASAEIYKEKLLNESEGEILGMVFQIVEKILGDAIEKGAVVSVVKEALKEAIGEKITVKVHPEDLEALRAAEPELRKGLQNIRSLATVADETIERGGCSVDTEVGTIDARLSTQLAAIKRSLGLV